MGKWCWSMVIYGCFIQKWVVSGFQEMVSMCFFDTILYYWIIGQRMLKSVGILLFCSCCFQTCSMCFPLSGGGGEVDEHSETPRESGRSTGGMLKWGWVSQGTTTSGWSGWIILTSLNLMIYIYIFRRYHRSLEYWKYSLVNIIGYFRIYHDIGYFRIYHDIYWSMNYMTWIIYI